MNDFLIKVERDSVCMGDDADAPHAYSFSALGTTRLDEIFEHLAHQHYLASVAGKNHSWDAIIGNESLARFEGNSQIPEPSSTLSTPVSTYAIGSVVHIYFQYNSASN